MEIWPYFVNFTFVLAPIDNILVLDIKFKNLGG